MKKESIRYPYFVKNNDVSQCILAVINKGPEKFLKKPIKKKVTNKIMHTAVINGTERSFYERTAKYKQIGLKNETCTKYRIVRGTNGKESTLYNVVAALNHGIIGRILTDEEFIDLYYKQSNKFIKMFNTEFNKAVERVTKK